MGAVPSRHARTIEALAWGVRGESPPVRFPAFRRGRGAAVATGISAPSVGAGEASQGGSGAGVALFADPALLIAFTSSDPEYAEYEARILAAAGRYRFLNGGACTWSAFLSGYGALTAAEKASVMLNIEEPWLAVLSRRTDLGVVEAWRTDPAVLDEAARKGVTIDGSTTLDQFRSLAYGLWNDATEHAAANGSSRIVHYGTTGVAFSEPTGAPRAGWRYDSDQPPSGATYWQADATYHPTMDEAVATLRDQDALASLMRASSGTAVLHHAPGIYSYVPLGSAAWSTIADWTYPGVTRRSAGSTVLPDYAAADLLHWVKATARREVQAYRDLADAYLADGRISSADYPPGIAPVVFPPCVQATVGDFRQSNQWHGFAMKDTATWVEAELVAMFSEQGIDSPAATARPDAVYLWCDVRTYFLTRAIAARAGGDAERLTNQTRFAWERDVFGRDPDPAGDPFPWGSTTQATLDAWHLANSLGDGWWVTDAEGPWWTVAGGSQLPGGLSIGPSCAIAEWLSFDADIGRAEVVLALRHFVSDRMASAVESAAEALASR